MKRKEKEGRNKRRKEGRKEGRKEEKREGRRYQKHAQFSGELAVEQQKLAMTLNSTTH